MTRTREITGRHVAIIFVAAFGVIIAVNIALAVNAVRSFPGLEVRNSYVASQNFDADRTAQIALGWTVRAEARDGMLILSITDRDNRAVEVADLSATLGRATHVQDDQTLIFDFDGERYSAPASIGAGNWNVRMIARASDGTEFRQRVVLHVRKENK